MVHPDSQDYKQKNVLILGLGISGRSAARFLLNRGAKVTGVDRNLASTDEELISLRRQGLVTLLDGEAFQISPFNLVVASPGISPSHPLYAQALAKGIEIIGEIELACRSIKQKCLAITGTNGKTTVTLLVEHVLNHSGFSACALGNVGLPLTSALDDPNLNKRDFFVIELSSFQLDTLQKKFIDAGVILNITPDHLDRYANMEAYAQSKIHIYDCLKPDGRLFVEERCHREFANLFKTCQLQSYGYSPECFIHTDKHSVFIDQMKGFALPINLQNKCSHDVENLMAAYALCHSAGVTNNQFYDAIQSFKKPAHRIEFVRTHAGVHYYDDSKGTNIDAVIRAVDSLDGHIVLIAGGVDKGFPYTPWLDTVGKKLKLICAIGKAKEKIKLDLGHQIPVELFASLDAAVAHAAKVSRPGDTVLLSPGCASFDMFKDYAHRGQEFQRIVNGL